MAEPWLIHWTWDLNSQKSGGGRGRVEAVWVWIQTGFLENQSVIMLPKVGVQVLATQKPINRPGGKESLLYFGCWQRGWGRTDVCPKVVPPPLTTRGARAFIDWGRGLHAETAQSALTIIFKLVTGGLTSFILIVLNTVNLQFQGQLFTFLWGQFLKLWQLMSQLQSGHRVVSVFHLVGVSVSIRQLTAYGSEYYP